MKHLTLRASPEIVQIVDEFARSRGLGDRSEAIRLAIRESVMDPAQRDTVADRDELLRLLSDSARSGSVTAMKALLDERRRDGDDDSQAAPQKSAIDELAARRAS